MANAIPVSRPAEKPVAEKPAVTSEPVIDHTEFHGKDHPEFGSWNGHGWHKSH